MRRAPGPGEGAQLRPALSEASLQIAKSLTPISDGQAYRTKRLLQDEPDPGRFYRLSSSWRGERATVRAGSDVHCAVLTLADGRRVAQLEFGIFGGPSMGIHGRFYFDATELVREAAEEQDLGLGAVVAAVGVGQWLNGYDRTTSAQLEASIRAEYDAERQNAAAMVAAP